jgi:hypothetical protein
MYAMPKDLLKAKGQNAGQFGIALRLVILISVRFKQLKFAQSLL